MRTVEQILAHAKTYQGYERHQYIFTLDSLAAQVADLANRSGVDTTPATIAMARATAHLFRPYQSHNASGVLAILAPILVNHALTPLHEMLIGAIMHLAAHEELECLEAIEKYSDWVTT